MNEQLRIIADGKALSRQQAEQAMHTMMRGEAEAVEVAGLLMGLRSRGEKVDELIGFTKVMRRYAVAVDLDDPHAIDLCGTGGDSSGTFNVSTAAALVCAGAGVTVAKHGNRAVSSKCGSADVLEALGVKVDHSKKGVEYCLKEAGIAFLFAPYFHPAMRFVMPVRRKLRVRTFFNILGPLCNPAGIRRQLVGAFNKETAQMMATILSALDAEHIIAVHSHDGMDEISLSAKTTLFEYHRSSDYSAAPSIPSAKEIHPGDFGIEPVGIEKIRGGTPEKNASILREIFSGHKGPYRDIVVLNAAFALLTSGKFPDLESCFAAACRSIDSGGATGSLERLIESSNAFTA